MDAGGAAGESNISSVVPDDRNGKGSDECSTDVDERPSIGVLQPQLDDRRAASRRSPSAGHEPVATVTQIVGDRDQREIDRFASLCSENVSLNS